MLQRKRWTQAEGMKRLVIIAWSLSRYAAASGDTYGNTTSLCIDAYIGDRMCDHVNNNEECGYDGGDCCPCDCDGCSSSSSFNYHAGYVTSLDGGFRCLNPESDCVDRVAVMYPDCAGYLSVGNGECDRMNNNEACSYDGGDCCPCDCDGCSSSDDYDSSSDLAISCLNPDSDCVDERVALYTNCTATLSELGDGKCDLRNNNDACDYDRGDCCSCDCSSTKPYMCGSSSSSSFFSSSYFHDGFHCVNPTSICVSEIVAEYPTCTGDLAYFGDKVCNDENNNESCGYDGGDCCPCTNLPTSASLSHLDFAYNCLDPDSGDERYGCEVPQVIRRCPAEGRQKWVIETLTQAQDLAETIYCSGGSFEVEWVGNVAVDRTISVVEGTVLNITGVGTSATMDASGSVLPLAVVNASLHMSDLHVSNGKGVLGGAVFASSSSTLTFNRTGFVGNAVTGNGGALFLTDDSRAFFSGGTELSYNTADVFGGAVYATNRSGVTWEHDTIFSGNTAGVAGGALAVLGGGSGSWTGNTSLYNNTAVGTGGGVYVGYNGRCSWTGTTSFSANQALDGGGMCVESGDVSWAGTTSFSDNKAEDWGGAIYAIDATVAWTRSTNFFGNSARPSDGAVGAGSGGALHISNAEVFWNAPTLFRDNLSGTGGGLYIEDGSRIEWSASTTFTSNYASAQGGAVGSTALETGFSSLSEGTLASFGSQTSYGNSSYSDSDYSDTYSSSSFYSGYSNASSYSYSNASSYYASSSYSIPTSARQSFLTIKHTTSFVNNSCRMNGGGMSLLGGLSTTFNSGHMDFSENFAGAAGGAVYISSVSEGPAFFGVTFTSNTAQAGGGVFVTGSGTAVVDGDKFPTTFDTCTFVNNSAQATGGAVESAAGVDVFENTIFRGNTARVGGGLRLAGTTDIRNCTFEENSSELNGGTAIFNMGLTAVISDSTFQGNAFDCAPGTFRNFSSDLTMNDTICYGCTFDPCDPEEKNVCKNPDEVPTCVAELEHSSSRGGATTVRQLVVADGYWRATNTSVNIRKCYNAEACPGGLTSGLCNEGYQGPYCSVCSEDYIANQRFTCVKCSDNTGGIALAAIFGVAGAGACLALVLYLVAGETGDEGRGVMARMTRLVPLQSVKIVIVAWQILTQFVSAANVTYPEVYQQFLDTVDIFNLDVSWILSAGCLMEVDFHDHLLFSTIAPLVLIGFLRLVYAVAIYRNGESEEALRIVRHKYVSTVLFITFLVYSSVSSVLFQTFPCDTLEDDIDEEKKFLRADYSIDCDSNKHKNLKIYAWIMIALYPVGIPVFYAALLFRNRSLLNKPSRLPSDSSLLKSTSDLWKPYKPSRYYYEVIECVRRISLTGLVLFTGDFDSAAQISVTLILAFVFSVVLEALAPYESRWDTWTSRTGHVVVFTSMYLALLLRVDVSNEDAASQDAFGAVLVAMHASMVSAVVFEAVIVACSLHTQRQEEEAQPRVRSTKRFEWNREESLVAEGPFSDDQVGRGGNTSRGGPLAVAV